MNKDLYELSYSLKKEMHHKIFLAVWTIILIYVAINLFLHFVAFPIRQTSASMESDIPKNSCIMLSPLKKNYSRGDVVLLNPLDKTKTSFFQKLSTNFLSFWTAQQIDFSNFSNSMGKSMQIRRILGLPGDTIYMRDYVLYIKPKGEKYFLTEFELVQKKYNVDISTNPAAWDNSLGVIGSFNEITLDKNEYFALADSRVGYIDSRLFGKITKSDINSSAIFQYFPFQNIRLFF